MEDLYFQDIEIINYMLLKQIVMEVFNGKKYMQEPQDRLLLNNYQIVHIF